MCGKLTENMCVNNPHSLEEVEGSAMIPVQQQ
jgi:hypothetical protein